MHIIFADKMKRFFPGIVASAILISVFFLLTKILPGIQVVEIDMEIDHPDALRVYFSNVKRFSEDLVSGSIAINQQRVKVKVSLGNGLYNYLRIDPGGQKGKSKIYSIKISSYFSEPVLFTAKEISEIFSPNADATLQVFPDFVEVTSLGNDPYLIGNKRLFPRAKLLSAGIACCFAVVCCIILLPVQQKPAGQKHGTNVSTTENGGIERFEALDGLRGVAALMVIADHTWGFFRGAGASGVWIFFALSGFLLARPFIKKPQLVLSLSYMSGYLRRRFLRILPMYYTYLVVMYFIGGRINLAFMHAFFLEGDGHLWAIPQEILFYLLWPVVILFLILPLKHFPKTTIVVVGLGAALWNRHMGIDIFWLLGMDHVRLPLFFGVFLLGACASYVFSFYSAHVAADSLLHKNFRRLAVPLGFVIILLFFVLSTGQLLGNRVVYSQLYFPYYGTLAGLLIFLILIAKGTLLDRVLMVTPLRSIGIVGLSLYLVHPVVKRLVDIFAVQFFDYKLKNLALFLVTLGCSYVVARFTYNYIELPAFRIKDGKK